MLGTAVRMGHGKPVFNGVLGSRIVVRVVDLLIYNGLQVRILGGVDLKSAGIQQVAGLAFRIVQLFHQGGNHLFNELVRKIAVMGIALLGSRVHILDPVIDIIRQGFLLLLF